MKRVYLIMLVISFSMNLFCQVHWTKYEFNPILEPDPEGWDSKGLGPMTVLFYDSVYHMWYDGYDDDPAPNSSGYATSQDGLIWNKSEANPVITSGADGEWDDYWMSDPVVFKEDTIYHMWYVGHTDTTINGRIGHAISYDGINWIKDKDNPLKDLVESIEPSDYLIPGPVIFDGSIFHMYYSTGNWSKINMAIFHAVSNDAYNWDVDPNNPVISDPGTRLTYPISIAYDGTTYFMFYHRGSYSNWETYLAYSTDGNIWEKYGPPVLWQGPTGSWDSQSITRSVVVFDSISHQFKMWYSGSNISGNPEIAIGYAVSDTCSDYIIPILYCDSTVLHNPETVEIMSSEDGVIYLAPNINYKGLSSVRETCLDSIEVHANNTAVFTLSEELEGIYHLYARDMANNVSFHHRLQIVRSTSIDKTLKQKFKLYPNPTSGLINIQTLTSGKSSIVISSLSGQELYRNNWDKSLFQINLSDYSNGIYIMTIESNDLIITKKIIKF